MFEFQTAISELTGLPVVERVALRGPVVGGGRRLPGQARDRPLAVRRLARPASAQPRDARHLRARLRRRGGRGAARGGATDPDALAAAVDDDTAAVFLQQPNFLGASRTSRRSRRSRSAPARCWSSSVDALTLGILRPPGDFGVDIALGEGQPLGNRLDFGGPSFGFFAARERYIRRMPGRIAGETVDVDGRRGFVLTLQTREQHIRREKATSNICTSQALNALAGMVYLAWLGKQGIVELGELMLKRTAYARERLAEIDGVELLHDQPVVREFALQLDAPVEAVLERCAAAGVNAGYALGVTTPSSADGLLVAITERRSRADIDRLADVLGERDGGSPQRPAATSARRCGRERAAGRRHADRRRPRTPMQRDAGGDDLREVEARPPRRDAAAARRPRPRRSEELIPPHLLRSRPPQLPEMLGARDRPPLQPPLAAQLRPRLAASTRSARAR